MTGAWRTRKHTQTDRAHASPLARRSDSLHAGACVNGGGHSVATKTRSVAARWFRLDREVWEGAWHEVRTGTSGD